MHSFWTGLALAGRWLVGSIAVALFLAAIGWIGHRALYRTGVAADQIQLTVVHWGDDDEDKIVAALVSDFEKENPDIRVKRVNPGQAAAVNTKLQTMFASGDPPDVMQLGYEKVADWGSKDLLLDLEPLLAADSAAKVPNALNLADFFEPVINCFRYDGKRVGRGALVGIAKDFTTAGFYYNKDLFRKAGVEFPKDDWTWDDFIAAARKIARLDGCYGAEFVTWEAMVRLYIWTEGVDFANEDFSEFRLKDPQLIGTLARLRSWFHDPAEVRTFFSAKTQLETGEDLFLSGRVGMSGPLGRWKVPTFRLIKDFDWDFAPLPRGKTQANGIFTSAWAIAKDSPHHDASWRLVRYLCGKRGQELSCGPGLAIPTMRTVAESELFIDPAQKPERDDAYLAMVPVARTIDWPSDPRYLHTLRTILETLLKTGALSAGDAMARVDRDWSAIRADQPVATPIAWGRLGLWLGLPTLAALALGFAAWWRGRPGKHAFAEERAGLLVISPWLIGFILFTAFPVLMSLLLAFCDWSGLNTIDKARWVGFANFTAMFKNETFRKALGVTAIYVLFAVPVGQLAAIGAALLMNHELKGIGFFRSAWYLPSVLAGVGMAVLWKWVFDDQSGLLNEFIRILSPLISTPLSWVGISLPTFQNIGWLEKDAERYAVAAFVIIGLWSIGGGMMIYLAGLKGIPQELYEAASIDGAVAWRRFTNVTLPMLSPVIFFNVIIAIIASFQVFTQAYVMTGGGPGDATRFYVVYLYNAAFDFHQMGFASAMAWMLLLIVLALTVLVMWGSKRFVYYEALKS